MNPDKSYEKQLIMKRYFNLGFIEVMILVALTILLVVFWCTGRDCTMIAAILAGSSWSSLFVAFKHKEIFKYMMEN